MPQSTDEMQHFSMTDPQFLFSRTALEAPAAAEPIAQEPVSFDHLTEKFPEMPFLEGLRELAAKHLEKAEAFGALVVRLDDKSYVIHPEAVMTALAGVVDAVCRESGGFWGLVEPFVFGCFFPTADQNQVLALSQRLKTRFAEAHGETVTTGIAVYPTLAYPKAEILDNALKALHHADFFGPDSCVAFDSVSLNISGDKFYQAGDLDGAMREYFLALALDETNVNVHNSLGVCHGIRQDLDKALEAFKTAFRLNPKENLAIYNAGYVHFLRKEYQDALAYFQKAEQIDDAVFELAIQTGRIHLALNQAEEARKYLEKATTLNPDSAAAFRLLGDAYAALDRITDAITAYKTALKRNPDDAEALSALGYYYELQGKNADIALMFCLRGIEMAPDNGLFRHRLGRLYLNRNQVEEALDQFQKARDLGHHSDEYIARTLKLLANA